METVNIEDLNDKYDEIVELCKRTKKPVIINYNGKEELILIDIKAFKEREQSLEAQSLILEGYEDIIKGRTISLEEAKKLLLGSIENK